MNYITMTGRIVGAFNEDQYGKYPIVRFKIETVISPGKEHSSSKIVPVWVWGDKIVKEVTGKFKEGDHVIVFGELNIGYSERSSVFARTNTSIRCKRIIALGEDMPDLKLLNEATPSAAERADVPFEC